MNIPKRTTGDELGDPSPPMNNPNEFHARKQHYLIRSHSLWNRSPELQQRFPEPGGREYADFVDSEAIIYQRELQDVGLAFPHWDSMVNVGGETDLRIFLKTGLGCFRQIRSHLPSSLANVRILDFGVGCGRTARFFFREVDGVALHGSDVDKQSVTYLQQEFPFLEAAINNNNPPLPYDNESFDYIYSISLFTHFNQNSFFAWMDEISRCLLRGGLALLTFHGSTAFKEFCSQNKAEKLNVSVPDWTQFKAEFNRKSFTWAPQKVQSQDVDSSSFGICFIDEQRIHDFLPKELRLVSYRPGALGGWQDLAVIRRT
jgi:SAM-dependent methyltransferase